MFLYLLKDLSCTVSKGKVKMFTMVQKIWRWCEKILLPEPCEVVSYGQNMHENIQCFGLMLVWCGRRSRHDISHL